MLRWPVRRPLVLALGMVWLSGCASFRTLTEYQPGDPVFLSGTRLDCSTINCDKIYLHTVRARPPAWPWIDLPFSFVSDLVFGLLPRTPPPPPGP